MQENGCYKNSLDFSKINVLYLCLSQETHKTMYCILGMVS